MNKYTYCQNEHEAWLEYFSCNSSICEQDCDCGMDFEQAKKWVVGFYQDKLEAAKNMTEDDF